MAQKSTLLLFLNDGIASFGGRTTKLASCKWRRNTVPGGCKSLDLNETENTSLQKHLFRGTSVSVTCILRWATYNQKPSCPQCKHPFESLNVHRSLDGCIHDYMFNESVCLLLRASWFVPLIVEAQEDPHEDVSHSYVEYDELGDELEEAYYMSSSSSALRIGNRRWGDNGYVRTGRKEARPVSRQFPDDSGAGPSRCAKKEEVSGDVKGRRAKRTLKREAADKAAAEKHQQRLQKLGLK